jgi:hypothetical protein
MKFMILIYGSDEVYSALEPSEIGRIMAAHDLLQKELRATGEFVDTNELNPDGAKTLRKTGGRLVATDGPFAEVKEIVAGYYLVDCASLERATELAGRLVEAEFAPVEVRPVGRPH